MFSYFLSVYCYLSLAIYDLLKITCFLSIFIWNYLSIGLVWTNMVIYGNVWSCLFLYGLVRYFMNLFVLRSYARFVLVIPKDLLQFDTFTIMFSFLLTSDHIGLRAQHSFRRSWHFVPPHCSLLLPTYFSVATFPIIPGTVSIAPVTPTFTRGASTTILCTAVSTTWHTWRSIVKAKLCKKYKSWQHIMMLNLDSYTEYLIMI